ncbi:hypothetical protein FB192DRAFT_1442959 [Mucor lusitanicus]|nr:hypothetical protein FB192DRAFT_1442959 [Mucor lusitanicus]
MLTINNTIYTYGGLAVDANGFGMSSSVQNSLSLMDVNSFQWTTGSNGLGLTDHTTCFMKACNCLVTFGGTSTGSPTDAVNIYDLEKRVWNVQGIQTAVGSSVPGARRLHTANCLDDYMVIYGGGTNQPADTDVWILNATMYPTLTWQKMAIANQSQGPNLRMGHSSVLDEANKKLYMFGGWGVSATNDSNVYVLDLNQWSWTRVATTGYPPNAMPPTNTTNPGNNNEPSTASKSNAGTIAGAAVGGVLGLLIIAAALFFILRRRRRQRNERDLKDEVSENISTRHHKDNPYSYNPGGFYSTNDSDDDDDNNDEAFAVSNKRMSKAWTGTMSTHHSQRRSEIGDSGRVYTGMLEAYNDDGTVAATHGSKSPRESFRNSKVLLVSPTTEYSGQGQVPNEIISQKPNEFSVPVTGRQQQQHHPVQHLISSAEEGPNSSSLDVLRSIKTNASSMMNHTGNSQSGAAFRKRGGGVPVTHATANEEDEDNWTFADSLSVNPYNNTSDNAPPIQYILPNSHQLSTATSTQTWDTKDAPQRQSLVHHHTNTNLQYPSSTLNMPMAQTVTPPTSTSNSSSSNVASASTNNQVNIYNSISPLDALASLGHQQQQQQLNNDTPSSSTHNSAMVKSIRDTSGKGIITADVTNAVSAASTTTPTSSSTTTSSSTSQPNDQRFLPLAPLISALPRRYQLDKTKAPITGPTNNILFVTKEDKVVVAVKSFGRREAWERECRNLIKLKSPCVVDILEVLTIQGDTSSHMDRDHHQEEEEEGGIQYVTVMERLDETLSTYIRHNSKKPTSNTTATNGSIARDILRCLSWCHGNGIAFCDLKPSNIMHHYGEPWKLIDFEASRTIDEECVGVITPRYCPPEVARATTYGLEGANGVVATASVDLWSLGCVIYELETKKALFASNIKDETILHFVSHPSPSTPILNNGLRWNENKELEIPQLERLIPNAHTRQLIKTLLSRDPSKRGSAPQLLEDPYFSL